MNPRSILSVALAALFVPGAAFGAQPPCSSASGDLIGCHAQVDGDLSVTSTLTLTDSVLEFTGSGAELQVTGQFVLREESQIIVAEGAGLAIEFLPGSTARLTDASIVGHDAFIVAADDLNLDNVTLKDAHAAIAVDGVAVTLERLTTRNVLDAVQAHGSAVVRVVDGSVEAQRDAVRATDGSDVRFENTSWAGSIDMHDSSRFSASWPVTTAVATDDPDTPVHVAFRDAHHEIQVEGPLAGAKQVFMVPGEGRSASGTTMHAPYFVSVVQGQRATHAILDFDRLAGTHVGMRLDLQIPQDDDTDAPQWPSQTPLRQTGPHVGYSRDGDAFLAWDHADDKTLDASIHSNRAVDHYRLSVDGSPVAQTRAASATVSGLAHGVHTLRVDAVDLVGNARPSNTLDVLVDPTAPQLTLAEDPDPSPRAAHAGPVSIQIDVEDLGAPTPSGLAWIRWNINDGALTYTCGLAALPACTAPPPPIDIDAPGNHTLRVTAQDRAGNIVEAIRNVVIDTAAPVFVAELRPQAPPNGWFQSAPTLHVNFTQTGPSGPGEIRWRLDAGDWNTFTAPEALAAPGDNTLVVEATDGAGNLASTQMRVAYDAYPPELSVAADGARGTVPWFTGPVTVTPSASDNASGLDSLAYREGSGAWRPVEGPLRIDSAGMHNLTFRAIDRSGLATTSNEIVQIDVQPPVPPSPDWSVLSDGTLRADWPRAPPYDIVSGIAGLRIERSDGAGKPVQTYSVPAGALGYAIVNLPMADHRIRIVATDGAGHENATDWEVVRGGNHGVLEEAPAKKVRGAVRLTPSLAQDEILEAKFHVDGGLVASKGDAPFAFRWDTMGFENGIHEVRIVTLDTAGLHHEEVRQYNLRNGYAAALADGFWHAALAGAAAVFLIAVSLHGTRAWRQEVLA